MSRNAPPWQQSKNITGSAKLEDRSMAKGTRREFGKIPEWAKQGPVTKANYDLRAEEYMATMSKAGRSLTPFLRLPGTYGTDDEDIPTADHDGWVEYWIWLSSGYGFPRQVAMFFEGRMKALNVPEITPEEFDIKFSRDPNFQARIANIGERITRERLGRYPQNTVEICNLFVPRGSPGFEKMTELARADALGAWAAPLYAKFGRQLNPRDYYRWDQARDGIHVNLKDYLAHIRPRP